MRLQANLKYNPNPLSEAALAASRQVWLAGLGAAVVSRDWLQAEAGNTFRSLVKEGTLVESRAIRYLGERLESSVLRANTLWKRTRASIENGVLDAADTAVLFVKETLPRALPKVELAVKAPRKQAARGASRRAAVGLRKPAAKPTTRPAVKRSAKKRGAR